MSDTWYYGSEGKAVGPYSFAQLQQMAAAGRIHPADHVCGDGQTWVVAGEVRDLFSAPAPFADPTQLGYQQPNLSAVTVTLKSMDFIRQTGLWVRIMAVILGITAGLMILGGIVVAIAGVVMPAKPDQPPLLIMGLVYAALGILYIVPCIYLWRYAMHCKGFTKSPQPQALEAALGAQKSFWKFIAIFTLAMIGLYVFALMIAAVGAILLHSLHR